MCKKIVLFFQEKPPRVGQKSKITPCWLHQTVIKEREIKFDDFNQKAIKDLTLPPKNKISMIFLQSTSSWEWFIPTLA